MIQDIYHSTCYEVFTDLKRKFYKAESKQTTEAPTFSSEWIEKPSPSDNSFITHDTILQDSPVENISVARIGDVEGLFNIIQKFTCQMHNSQKIWGRGWQVKHFINSYKDS